MDELKSQLLRFNSIYNDTNRTYHRLALSLGLPDCAFLILYLLRMSDRLYTQSEICELMCLSRQTVNSALKTLAARDISNLSTLTAIRRTSCSS